MNIYSKFIRFYLRNTNPVKYARFLGVKVGHHAKFAKSIHFSSEPYLITIGDHVGIAGNVSFHTHGGARSVRNIMPNFDFFGKIKIEDWVYIGSNSIILPGVTVGEGTLVGAGSVVTKSTPPHCVVGGNPARVICSIEQFAEKYKQFNVGTKGLSGTEKRKILLELPDEKFIKK